MNYFHFLVWGKYTIGGSKVGSVCAGGVFFVGLFCVESFPLSEMGDKFPIGVIDGVVVFLVVDSVQEGFVLNFFHYLKWVIN